MTATFKTLSVLSHPLFLCFYTLCFWLWLDPYAFGYSKYQDGALLLFYTFIITILLPGLALVMMYKLQLIQSLEMPKHTDRIIPLLVGAVFYFWYYINCRSNPELPLYYKYLVFAINLLLITVFITSIFYKISLHTSAWGLLFVYGLMILTRNELFIGRANLFLFLFTMLVLIIGGLVGTIRLGLNAHKLQEVVTGYIIGASIAVVGYIIHY